MRENFGFIHEKTEIKILVLFIMRRLSDPITFDVLTELVMCDDGIGYFDFTECVTDLLKTEHLTVTDGKYTITDKGIRNGEITENSLPFSVRQRAVKATNAMRMKLKRNMLITTSHTSEPNGGCRVNLALSDGVGDLINMELFTVNEKQAKALEDGFRIRAESIYHSLIEIILDK